MVCTGLHWSAMDCTGLHWFTLVCTGLDRTVALVLTGLYWFTVVNLHAGNKQEAREEARATR